MRTHHLLIPLLCLAACQTQPPVVATPSFHATPALSVANPADIAVLPVTDETNGDKVSWMLNDLRRAAAEELVVRRYSPLDFAHVDRALATVPASAMSERSRIQELAGSFGAEAVLALRVEHWNDSELMSSARVRFVIEALLVGSESGEVLWSGRLEGSAKAGGGGPAPLDRQERARSAGRLAVREVLRHLDQRRP